MNSHQVLGQLKPLPLCTIPNKEGYKFLGLDVDRRPVKCCVVRGERTGLHVVINEETREPCFFKLVGWRRL